MGFEIEKGKYVKKPMAKFTKAKGKFTTDVQEALLKLNVDEFFFVTAKNYSTTSTLGNAIRRAELYLREENKLDRKVKFSIQQTINPEVGVNVYRTK